VRLAYFSLAALWGFLAGSAAILTGLALRGTWIGLDAMILGALVLAAVLAVVGAGVAAAAYRDAGDRG